MIKIKESTQSRKHQYEENVDNNRNLIFIDVYAPYDLQDYYYGCYNKSNGKFTIYEPYGTLYNKNYRVKDTVFIGSMDYYDFDELADILEEYNSKLNPIIDRT